jgi:hypothetical protein
MRGAHLRGGPGERPVPDHAGRGRRPAVGRRRPARGDGKAGSTPLHLAVAPTGASGTAGASDLQLEIVRLLLAAGATLADEDRYGVAVADRIQSQALRTALAAGQL